MMLERSCWMHPKLTTIVASFHSSHNESDSKQSRIVANGGGIIVSMYHLGARSPSCRLSTLNSIVASRTPCANWNRSFFSRDHRRLSISTYDSSVNGHRRWCSADGLTIACLTAPKTLHHVLTTDVAAILLAATPR